MTTYIALSPRRRTEHPTWYAARDALVGDALDLSTSKRDRAEKDAYIEAAKSLADWVFTPESRDLRLYDRWANPVTFRIIVQEQILA